MPPSPWIGSSMMAHVSASIAFATRVEVAERGVVEAGQHRLDARVVLRLAVAVSAPIVRPWKLPVSVTILYRPSACR